jgi:hypothetical protein
MLLYPILGLFLSAVWLSNSFAIYDIADYISSQIKPRVGEDNTVWEHVRSSTDTRHLAILHFFGTRGLFIGTELVALLAGITIAKFDLTQKVFLAVALVSSILTILLLSTPYIKRRR